MTVFYLEGSKELRAKWRIKILPILFWKQIDRTAQGTVLM
jgi:hypothetical protein